ncbi:MAG: hypothetical protein A2309_09885 [Bacteroidetes bacterium RIFOXYB2_FULL_35_7]|nr:MAG: hypothetical protein A2X01_06640 [Bacteroidetes bacterium GWF2_35_48]OFY93612.1 MAG: hypothetical protein A2491_01070 [Bacteroidetes bacterium RIFOXYC12_FULL_35_7]OFY96995.1 MAG: hypothetical protein A2309_09885 [Bacteroidetes bacterium RIFOXYB2_FULL_35_7]
MISFIINAQNKIIKEKHTRKIDSLLNILHCASHDTIKVRTFALLCDEYRNNDPEKAMQYGKQGLFLAQKIAYKRGTAICYNNIGNVHNIQGSYLDAIEYYQKSIDINEELGDKKSVAHCYGNIGIIYKEQGNYPKAIEYYQQSLKKDEELGDKKGMAQCFGNIGIVYYNQGNFSKAIEYMQKDMEIAEELRDNKGMASCYNNLGVIYIEQKKYSKALEYYQMSLKISEKSGDKKGIAQCYGNFGIAYYAQGNYPNALKYYQQALAIFEELGNKGGITITLGNIASSYNKLKKYNNAIEYAEKSLKIAKEIGSLDDEMIAFENLAEAYDSLGNTKKELIYYKLFTMAKDSLFNEEKHKQITKMEAIYQTEKKQKEIELKNTQLAKKEVEVKQQKTQKFAFIGSFILMLILSVVIFKSYRDKKKANILLTEQKHEIEEKNEELNQQNAELAAQRDYIAQIHENITESIRYAERIQKAVLPDEQYIKNRIQNDFFILFKPKDIVSGDFYFVEQRKNKLLIAVADCTGHGVPGAFMSMLGISFLNEIIAKEGVQSASHVLDELRNYVIHSLQQKGIMGEQKDGMDIAFVALNINTNELQFAGANNPIYLIHTNTNNELTEIKGDKMPVAIHDSMNNFTNQIIQLQKGDIFYLMSDGYKDQFGGSKGKKFLSNNLKQLLCEHCIKSMNEQKEVLDNTIENWKTGYEIKYEQTDDITVFGIKIN